LGGAFRRNFEISISEIVVNGILVVDKPENFTSHDVVAKVRRILKTRGIGHTGTLDPFATGVLVILVGRATRLAQFLDKAEKEYLATVQFGFETDTGDKTGSPKPESQISNSKFQIPNSFSDDEIDKVLNQFRGDTWQTPPMYSAKKIAGKKLYELARKGVEIERQPVKINISTLEIVEVKNRKTENQMTVRVACSAGTYIRVLAENIGKALGTGAHLAELRRTRAGNFDLSNAVTLEDLEKLAIENEISQSLISPRRALAHLPETVLDDSAARKTLNGIKLFSPAADFLDGQFVRMCDARENLIAVGVFDRSERTIQPRVVLALDEK
jgi:tRNA pseudouridine55 synthase